MGKKKPVKSVVLPPGVSLKDFWQAGGTLQSAATVKKQQHTFEGQLIEEEDLPQQVLSPGIVHRHDVAICLNVDSYISGRGETLCRKCYPITDAQIARAQAQQDRDPMELIYAAIQAMAAGQAAGGTGGQTQQPEPIILPDIVEDLPTD